MKPTSKTPQAEGRPKGRFSLNLHDVRKSTLLTAGAAGLLVSFFLIIFLSPGAFTTRKAFVGIETGKIAGHDVIGERDLVLVDEKATAIRMEAEEKLVLPVFTMDPTRTVAAVDQFRAFNDLFDRLVEREIAADTIYLSVQKNFPGLLSRNVVLGLFNSPMRQQIMLHVEAVLRKIMERGIAAIPDQGLEYLNPDYIELRRLFDGRTVVEELPMFRLVTKKNLGTAIDEEMSARYVSRVLSGMVGDLVVAFAMENVFFDTEQSDAAREKARKGVDPVLIRISQGEKIIRKGSVVSEADFAKVQAARTAVVRQDWNMVISQIGILSICALLSLFLLGHGGLSGRRLGRIEAVILAVASFLFFALSLVTARFISSSAAFGTGYYLPTALIVMLTAVLAGSRFAVLYSIILGLLAMAGAGISGHLFIMVVLAGISGAFVVRASRSRIDMVRAAVMQAVIQTGIALLLAINLGFDSQELFQAAIIHAGNGFLCGVLALALLPVLEQTLNSPTQFRLLELSDLNTPIMKRMQSVAPGTYSHSITVAHLAESACREIGADPLLARVGAYYHDIGKIEQPEYFIENQVGYNKHEEINPRLSATVIRSHVKIGAETARGLGLPDAVVDIIAQHHGNGVIVWFYEQAKKADKDAKPEDFSYTGDQPVSKEAGIVMLADAVEASTRTLKKPTVPRLDQFIHEILDTKIAAGQLDHCELTFRDIGIVRASFTKILAGYYHSRIEYPKPRESSR